MGQTESPSKAMLWTGRIMSALPALLLIGSASMKLTQQPQLAEGMEHMGWPIGLAVPLGVVELSSAILYLIPQTAVLGAILITGYMGGAIATHVRIGEPFFMQIAVGVLVWGGLYLRDLRLRELLPLRR